VGNPGNVGKSLYGSLLEGCRWNGVVLFESLGIQGNSFIEAEVLEL
jgi:hypothetical protein